MSENTEKIFYSIGEVALKTDLPKYVIRFWESEFKQISPKRNQGRRLYKEKDIEIILKIKDLLYKDGLTIKGAKKLLDDKSEIKIDTNIENNLIKHSKVLRKFSFNNEKNINKEEFIDILNKLNIIENISSK